jgi:hypothetical protein
MDKDNNKLKKIMDGKHDFSTQEMEKNAKALKKLIIQFKQGRGKQTQQIDHIETTDLAWNLAEHLPDGVVIKAHEIPPEQPWNGLDYTILAFVFLLVASFVILIMLTLFL